MYHYHGANTLKAWKGFIEGGYAESEGETVPRTAATFTAAVREVRIILERVTRHGKEYPVQFILVIVFCVIMVYISHLAVSWLMGKLEKMEKDAKENKIDNEPTTATPRGKLKAE